MSPPQPRFQPIESGALGVTLVAGPDELEEAVEAASVLDDRILIEDVVHGREIDVAVLGRRDGTRLVSAPLEPPFQLRALTPWAWRQISGET